MGSLHIISVLAFFEKSRYRNRAHTIIYYYCWLSLKRTNIKIELTRIFITFAFFEKGRYKNRAHTIIYYF